MKQVVSILLVTMLLYSRQKEITQKSELYLDKVKTVLKDSLQNSMYQTLDFERSVLSDVDSMQLYILRIPYKNNSLNNGFVILQTSKNGIIKKGAAVQIDGKEKELGIGNIKRRIFNGSVIISSLDQHHSIHSNIIDGYIEAFHQKENVTMRTASMQAPDELPEVIVVAYVNSGGITYSTWVNLMSFFPDYGSGGGGGYYGSLDGLGGSSFGGYGGGGGSSYSSGGLQQEPPIHVDVETYVDHPAIDLNKYLTCFDNIPDNGATCSIEIFTDIPVDSDPTKLFDWNTESPGHTFLQIKKCNGSQHELQNIGFYPSSNWKNILNADPVTSKMVDDGNHEYNASLKMNITPYQLRIIMNKMKELSTSKYDMDEFNCTDFAMEVFNSIRTNEMDIPRYNIPGGVGIYPSRTPQGLFNKLSQMKQSGDPEANNISLGFYKSWVASSDGPCN